MSNIATTIEQSKHLLELGLSKKTSDMSYSEEYFGRDKDGNDEWCWKLNACKFIDIEGIIPAWSLSALLEVIKGVFAYTTIAISGASKGFNFIRCKDLNYIWTHDVNADSPIGAAYEMVCLLLKQGLIKKGGNDENETNVHSNAD